VVEMWKAGFSKRVSRRRLRKRLDGARCSRVPRTGGRNQQKETVGTGHTRVAPFLELMWGGIAGGEEERALSVGFIFGVGEEGGRVGVVGGLLVLYLNAGGPRERNRKQGNI